MKPILPVLVVGGYLVANNTTPSYCDGAKTTHSYPCATVDRTRRLRPSTVAATLRPSVFQSRLTKHNFFYCDAVVGVVVVGYCEETATAHAMHRRGLPMLRVVSLCRLRALRNLHFAHTVVVMMIIRRAGCRRRTHLRDEVRNGETHKRTHSRTDATLLPTPHHTTHAHTRTRTHTHTFYFALGCSFTCFASRATSATACCGSSQTKHGPYDYNHYYSHRHAIA